MARLSRDQRHRVNLTLNGRAVSGWAEPRMLLADFLRENFGLMSVHTGCEHGVCGACTLRIDGRPARSCLSFAVQADGRRIDTIEGLAEADGTLSDLQAAFRRHHALQCGYCTPGILMSVEAFLETNADPSEEQIRDMLSGHLCRCTGYVGMVRAIADVAARRNRAGLPAV